MTTGVDAAPAGTDFWGTTASQLQTGLTINNTTHKMTGTVNYIASGQIVTDWNNHHFIGLAFEPGADAVKVEVGIKNLVALDEDLLALISIEDKTKPFRVVTTYTNGQVVEVQYDLSGLTLANS